MHLAKNSVFKPDTFSSPQFICSALWENRRNRPEKLPDNLHFMPVGSIALLPVQFHSKNATILRDSSVKSSFVRGAGGFRAEKVDIIRIIRNCGSV